MGETKQRNDPAAAPAAVSDSGPEKVDALLLWRHRFRSAGAAVKDKVQGALEAVDPRANRDDYVRRRTRFETRVKSIKEDDNLRLDAPFQTELKAIDLDARNDAYRIDGLEQRAGSVDYGAARGRLAAYTDRLDKAQRKAAQRHEQRAKDRADIVGVLDRVAEALAEAPGNAPSEKIKTWQGSFDSLTASFHAQGGKPPAFDKIRNDARDLFGQIDRGLQDVAGQRAQQQARRDALEARMSGAPLSREQRFSVTALLARAGQEMDIFEFVPAGKTLDDARDALDAAHAPAAGKAPSEGETKALLGKTFDFLKSLQGRAAPDVRERFQPISRRLEMIGNVLDRDAPDALGEAHRMIMECRADLDVLAEIETGREDFADQRDALAVSFPKDCADLGAEITEFCKQAGLPDAAPTEPGRLLAALMARFDKEFPKLLTEKDYTASGFEAELLLTRKSLVDLQADPGKAKESARTEAFRQLAKEVETAVAGVKGSNSILLLDLDLLEIVPKRIEEGEKALAANEDAKLQVCEAALRKLLTDIQAGMAAADPASLTKRRDNALVLATRLAQDVEIGRLALLDAADNEGRARKGARGLLKRVPGAKNFVGNKAAEREATEEYGATLGAEIEAFVATVSATDAAAVTAAEGGLQDLRTRVETFKKMVKVATGAAERDAKDPASFATLTALHDDIAKLIEKKVGDLPQRAADFKEWTETLAHYENELTATDPAVMEQNLKTLQTEVSEGIAKAEKEAKDVKDLLKETILWQETLLQKNIDRPTDKPSTKPDGWSRGASRAAHENAAFVEELRRRIDAYRTLLETQQRPSPKERDAIRADLTALRAAKVDAEKQKTAKTADEDFRKVREELSALINTTLRLADEDDEGLDRKQRRVKSDIIDRLADLARDALVELDATRSVDSARQLIPAIKRELTQVQAGGVGDVTSSRKNLKSLDARWRNAVDALRDATRDAAREVAKECAKEADPSYGLAADALRDKVLVPVANLLDPDGFRALVAALTDDEADVAKAREALLAEVRRLRNLLRADARVRRLRADNPFGFILPIAEVFDRLNNIELVATQYG
jgi:hypothetical protein